MQRLVPYELRKTCLRLACEAVSADLGSLHDLQYERCQHSLWATTIHRHLGAFSVHQSNSFVDLSDMCWHSV